MTKLTLFIALGLGLTLSENIMAMEFVLPCQASRLTSKWPKKVPKPVSFVKRVTKSDGKWNTSYVIRVAGQDIPLVPANNGDEDYNDYKVAKGNSFGITGAGIQNRFEWANIKINGSGAIDCSKR